jgi:hypothetical protein
MVEVVYVSQETAATRAIAPAKVIIAVEKAVGRRIVTLMKRVT